jgi:hypothetical protein
MSQSVSFSTTVRLEGNGGVSFYTSRNRAQLDLRTLQSVPQVTQRDKPTTWLSSQKVSILAWVTNVAHTDRLSHDRTPASRPSGSREQRAQAAEEEYGFSLRLAHVVLQ